MWLEMACPAKGQMYLSNDVVKLSSSSEYFPFTNIDISIPSYSWSLLKFSEESWLCYTRIFVHIYGTPLKSQDSHGDLSKNKLKPNTVQSFSISAWPKGSKPTARAKPPGLIMLGIANHYPSKQPVSCSGWESGWEETRQDLVVHILLWSPAWGMRRAQLLGWQAGNILPSHTVCCPAMETHAMDSQCHQPSFTKQTTVKKGFHWHGLHPHAHSSSDHRVGVNSGMLTCLWGGLFGGFFASWIYLINFYNCPWVLAHHCGTEKYNMTTKSLWYLLSI